MDRFHDGEGQRDSLQGTDDFRDLAYRLLTSSKTGRAFDISREDDKLRDRYGRNQWGQGCLMARRLVERGVRFVQLYHGNVQPWDSHSEIGKNHRKLAGECDQGIAALLTDLKQRGLLEDTLVVWSTEFGRTPERQGATGRGHHAQGFTFWLAGGGVKSGFGYGSTDEFGYHAVDKPVSIHDLHATLLHQMGIDHEKLTYRFSGRDYRLTDVHGRILHELIA